MNPFEIIGELCTFDSAYVRGWRWLFSASYRALVREDYETRNPMVFAAWVLWSALLMATEIVAVTMLTLWVLRL